MTAIVLTMAAIAEGIETEIEAAIIKELGADFVQGYYFARPSERF